MHPAETCRCEVNTILIRRPERQLTNTGLLHFVIEKKCLGLAQGSTLVLAFNKLIAKILCWGESLAPTVVRGS